MQIIIDEVLRYYRPPRAPIGSLAPAGLEVDK